MERLGTRLIKHTIYEIIKQIAKILDNTINLMRSNFVFEKLNYLVLLERKIFYKSLAFLPINARICTFLHTEY